MNGVSFSQINIIPYYLLKKDNKFDEGATRATKVNNATFNIPKIYGQELNKNKNNKISNTLSNF